MGNTPDQPRRQPSADFETILDKPGFIADIAEVLEEMATGDPSAYKSAEYEQQRRMAMLLTDFALRDSNNLEVRSSALRATIVGSRIGRLIMAEQYEHDIPAELRVEPDFSRLIPDGMPRLNVYMFRQNITRVSEVGVMSLGLSRVLYAGIANAAISFQIYGHDLYSTAYTVGEEWIYYPQDPDLEMHILHDDG
jgi:hypothetical protein